jgi:acyl carrier protein
MAGMPSRSEIEQAVIAILAAQLLLPESDVTRDAAIDELGLDSLGKVEAIFAMEERFGISIPFNANAPDQPDFDLSSVSAIVGGLERLIANKGA